MATHSHISLNPTPYYSQIDTIQKPVDEIVTGKLENMDKIRQLLVNGAMVVY